MANKLYEESSISAIAAAIRAKNGSSDTYTVAQMANAIANIPSGGGDVTNGTLESYKAVSGTIAANTFIEMTDISNRENHSFGGSMPSIVRLSDNAVFVAYNNGSSILCGQVYTVSGTNVTKGTETKLASNTSRVFAQNSVVKIASDKVMVIFARNASSSDNTTYGVVCTISGTTITVGTPVQISNVTNSCNNCAIESIDTDKAFVVFRNGSYPYGVVCTISGTTITVGTAVQLSAGSDSYEYAIPVRLETNKVFVSHRYGNYAYGVVCTISGTTITVGTDTQLSTYTASRSYPYPAALSSNKVFMSLCQSNCAAGQIVTISGTTITVGAITIISDFGTSYYGQVPIALTSDEVYVMHADINGTLVGTKCIISETTVTPGTLHSKISTSHNSYSRATGVLLSNRKILYTIKNAVSLGVFSVVQETGVAVSISAIDGLTKTQCTTSTAGDVWVLTE